ncbi:MAG: GNAT family N-acetyltransferase [Dehalococcoidia bacterium]|nr:GNAT family N-acetyltransferase [Dehalococcoidia bacterium]
MSIEIIEESLKNLRDYYAPRRNLLEWPCVFMLPGWLEAWWHSFGDGYRPMVAVILEDGAPIGIAPLKIKDGAAYFIGDNSVCDYLDFITVPGKEQLFSRELLDYLRSMPEIDSVVLETLRPDSVALGAFIGEAQALGLRTACEPIDVSYEMALPANWDDYLLSLEGAQRRDFDRKLRQLEAVAEVRFNVLHDGEIEDCHLETLFSMMANSRGDKAKFLTAPMQSYFRSLASHLASYGVLRLGFLDVGVARAAAVLYFEYGDGFFLYNSGYEQGYAPRSVGLLSKLLSIRHAVESGKNRYDFLKGAEPYKDRMGGRPVELYCCSISLR